MMTSPRIYHELLQLRSFFFHEKEDYIEIYFAGKRIKVFPGGVFGYIRSNSLLIAKRNKYHQKKEKRKLLRKRKEKRINYYPSVKIWVNYL